MWETFEREWTFCHKKTCKRCPHGPYWYGYKRERGRLKKRYIGKKLPEHIERMLASGRHGTYQNAYAALMAQRREEQDASRVREK
jgi:hypothetical protein